MAELKKDKVPLFYQLTNKEWVETVKDLTGAEIKVLYHVRSLDPFGDRLVEYSITQMADNLGLSKGAVSKAVKKLVQVDLLEAKLFGLNYSDTEHQIRDRMKAELGGEVEVVTAFGRIDLLTASEVIEIKNINDWKEALGKILAYSSFFPEHQKRIHLFGRLDLTKLALAQATCSLVWHYGNF